MAINKEWIPLLSNVDLIFHEAGHTILFFFGDFIRVLGGTVGQLAVPFIVAINFLFRQSLYASMIALWWVGENLTNISVYVADAREQVLPLLGGEIHDWLYLLGKTGLLQHDLIVAKVFWVLGSLIMISALVVATLTIFQHEKQRPRPTPLNG